MGSIYTSRLSFLCFYIGIILLASDAGICKSSDDGFVAMDQIERINKNSGGSVIYNYFLTALYRWDFTPSNRGPVYGHVDSPKNSVANHETSLDIFARGSWQKVALRKGYFRSGQFTPVGYQISRDETFRSQVGHKIN